MKIPIVLSQLSDVIFSLSRHINFKGYKNNN